MATRLNHSSMPPNDALSRDGSGRPAHFPSQRLISRPASCRASAFSGRFLLCLFADACRRFGGAVVVISADQILGKSTNDLLEAFIAQVTR